MSHGGWDHRLRGLPRGWQPQSVDWNALHFALDKKDPIILDLTRDQVKAAPEYKDGRPLVLIGTAESLQPYPASE
jgi:hypothetical protein